MKIFVFVWTCLIVMMSVRYWQSESESLLVVLHEWTEYTVRTGSRGI